MTTFIKSCRGEKKKRKKIDVFKRKLMIPDSELQDIQNTK